MATTGGDGVSTADSKPAYVTRSGRISRPPQKFVEEMAQEIMEDDYDTDDHESVPSDVTDVTSICSEEDDDDSSMGSFVVEDDDDTSSELSKE